MLCFNFSEMTRLTKELIENSIDFTFINYDVYCEMKIILKDNEYLLVWLDDIHFSDGSYDGYLEASYITKDQKAICYHNMNYQSITEFVLDRY